VKKTCGQRTAIALRVSISPHLINILGGHLLPTVVEYAAPRPSELHTFLGERRQWCYFSWHLTDGGPAEAPGNVQGDAQRGVKLRGARPDRSGRPGTSLHRAPNCAAYIRQGVIVILRGSLFRLDSVT
jgi:hypothetical protein